MPALELETVLLTSSIHFSQEALSEISRRFHRNLTKISLKFSLTLTIKFNCENHSISKSSLNSFGAIVAHARREKVRRYSVTCRVSTK